MAHLAFALKVKPRKQLVSPKPKIVIPIGYPTSGKDEHGSHIANRFGIEFVSSTNLILEEGKQNEQFKQVAETCRKKGELIPDDLMLTLFKKKINQLGSNTSVVLGGWPRNISQFIDLYELNTSANRAEIILVHLNVDRRVCEKRIQERAIKQQRSDDLDPAAVQNRLDLCEEETFPIIGYARSIFVPVYEISGDRPQYVVANDVIGVLSEAGMRSKPAH